jgi:phasin
MTDLPKFEIPSDMRAFAEKSVEQAKKAFETFITTAQNAVHAVEDRASDASAGARSVAELSMHFAEENIKMSFEFAERLVRAGSPQEAMQLQADYVRAQMQALTRQTTELAAAATKAATPSTPTTH